MRGKTFFFTPTTYFNIHVYVRMLSIKVEEFSLFWSSSFRRQRNSCKKASKSDPFLCARFYIFHRIEKWPPKKRWRSFFLQWLLKGGGSRCGRRRRFWNVIHTPEHTERKNERMNRMECELSVAAAAEKRSPSYPVIFWPAASLLTLIEGKLNRGSTRLGSKAHIIILRLQ